ncbi:tail protein [Haloactinospora alba]|uniref:Tail protein n=1 Tax=Haloactinospora alba TaxID=405555 RepID=A0A543N8Y7_9ACTN|nr:phage tail domain-containing protein [Haloactinospora alba]TQN28269.1 tail protein [Haloactinospora alba]
MNEQLQLPVYTVDDWSGNTRDNRGVEWWVTGDEGWTGSPPPRVELTDRPQRHGAFDAASYRSPRVITLEGVAIAPDRRTKEEAKDRFAALLADGSALRPLVVREHTATRRVEVRLTDESRLRDTTPHAFEWSLQVTAPDPNRYSARQHTRFTPVPTRGPGVDFPLTFPLDFGRTSGGRFTLTNAGTIPTAPVWHIDGPCENPAIQELNGDGLLEFDISLTARQRLTVDVDARTVVLGSATSRRASLRAYSRWFPLRPGDNTILFRTTRGGPDPRPDDRPGLHARWRDAWL